MADDILSSARGTFNTISNKSFADNTRREALNSFIGMWNKELPENQIDEFTSEQFTANEKLLREASGKLIKQMDMVDKGDLDQESFFTAADDVFEEVMGRVDLDLNGKFNVPKGGGVVQELTGDQVTRETQVPPNQTREPVISPKEGIQRIEKISQEAIDARIGETNTTGDAKFRDMLNARFELQAEAIAKRDGVLPAEVDAFVRKTAQDTRNADPVNFDSTLGDEESLLQAIMSGKLRVPPTLTEENIKIYTDQGISREDVIKAFNDKFGVQDASAQ